MKTFILLILAAGTFCSLGFRYKEGSLGYRLMQLHSDRAMSFEFSLNDHRRILLPVPEIKRRLQSKTNALQAARELTRYKELGILNKTITCSTLLNHVIPYRTAISLLTGAAIVEASEGKMKEAVRDFERACTISRTFLKGCKTLIEIYYHNDCCKQLTGAIRSSALPPEMKKNCLRKIPKRKAISAVLPTVLELEKRIILAAKDAKNRKETEIFFTVNEFSSAERKAFNSLSREKLSELLEKFNQQICKEFAAKTLTRNTPVLLRTGSPVGDAVLQKICGVIVRGLGKVSDTLAGRKKQ